MITNSINVEVTAIYEVITVIDWFMDRFRTAINVTGDLYGAAIVIKTKMSETGRCVRPGND
ncbi:hypothetical protein PAAG_01672 [Paracoccidioides lutzii Pb01]|uniref:Amino acid transporter n=1 Tax=Paracoccidioides lutzii (strain ATCC MYA-826 / Pb01) TaxID=502779 RepID=C1GT27_PARBA|nr:hypothetical protein PAAG_01672 [Paracoccidioides lutzii Pb01]EEH39210.2 hypothetical protein PAAG_01672 [Paracoccidioides lutzii Pb01]